jgi:hypothetical protein
MSDQNRKHPEPEVTRKKHVPLKEYGLMKVLEWPDGTQIHINTKAGEENMRIFHSSGTYHEFTSEGTHVNFNSNNAVQYSKGGMTVTMDNNSDGKASGHMRVSFDHDAHVEFKKNASIVVGGKTNIASMGDLKIAGKGNVYLGSGEGKVVINGGKGVEIKGEKGRVMIEAAKGVVYLHSKEGDVHLQAKQDVVQVSEGDNIVQADGKVSEISKGNNETKADGNLTEESGGDRTSQSGGKTRFDADGKFITKGSLSQIQEGGQQISPTSDIFV